MSGALGWSSCGSASTCMGSTALWNTGGTDNGPSTLPSQAQTLCKQAMSRHNVLRHWRTVENVAHQHFLQKTLQQSNKIRSGRSVLLHQRDGTSFIFNFSLFCTEIINIHDGLSTCLANFPCLLQHRSSNLIITLPITEWKPHPAIPILQESNWTAQGNFKWMAQNSLPAGQQILSHFWLLPTHLNSS